MGRSMSRLRARSPKPDHRSHRLDDSRRSTEATGLKQKQRSHRHWVAIAVVK